LNFWCPVQQISKISQAAFLLFYCIINRSIELTLQLQSFVRLHQGTGVQFKTSQITCVGLVTYQAFVLQWSVEVTAWDYIQLLYFKRIKRHDLINAENRNTVHQHHRILSKNGFIRPVVHHKMEASATCPH